MTYAVRKRATRAVSPPIYELKPAYSRRVATVSARPRDVPRNTRSRQPLETATPPRLRLPALLPLGRPLVLPYQGSPPCRTSNFAADDTRITHPSPADITGTRRYKSCQSTSSMA